MSQREREEHHLWRRCDTPDQLHVWVRLFTGLDVPRSAVCARHVAPFEYLCRAYFEPAQDLVVWAPRGGGKTRLAAVATLLDLLHKPGCAVRILGGSLEQSLKMWEHLMPDVMRLAEGKLVKTSASSRRVSLSNGSSAAALTQSQRAVRGLRVQKLRCDEVELFDEQIWEAAQLVTRSSGRGVGATPASPCLLGDRGKGDAGVAPTAPTVSGVVEAISTLHTPFGLMQRIIESAQSVGRPVLSWCLLEVLQRCPPERDCATCPLWEECRGVAKTACSGFVSIDDAIAMKKRVSLETWQAEMLCLRPSVRGCVFPNFDPAMHVVGASGDAGVTPELSLALDFGFANPFVCLWIASGSDGTTHVIDEYVQPMRTIEEHLEVIGSRQWGKVKTLACDPAGAGRNDQTADSNVRLLRRRGYAVKCRRSLIVEGLELIRAALRPAFGGPKLFIHPRCVRLIRALQSYRYAEGGSELPLKDGQHDHLIDALRYHFVNIRREPPAPPRRY